MDSVAQWLINISKNHHLLSEALELSYNPPRNPKLEPSWGPKNAKKKKKDHSIA